MGEGYLCVSRDVEKELVSKMCHKGHLGKRNKGLEVILFIPHPPARLECPSPTKLKSCVALKLAAVNVVSDILT